MPYGAVKQPVMEVQNSPLALSSYSDEPIYNVKAVCVRTGITGATLRAWERRYGVPAPKRTENSYRLYSERDIAIVAWLLQQTEAGVNIGQAIYQLTNMLAHGHDPAVKIAPAHTTNHAGKPRSPELICHELTDALAAMAEAHAEELLNEAIALYTLETTLINILRNAVEAIRADHQQHQISATVERFAVTYARRRLRSMIQAAQAPRTAPAVLLLGFPAEHNEIDLMILDLLLRRHGWPVTNLGNDLAPSMLNATLDNMNPALVFYLVDHPAHARYLAEFSAPQRQGKPIWCVCGGRAFEAIRDSNSIRPFEYLGEDLRAIVRALVDHLGRDSHAVAGAHGD